MTRPVAFGVAAMFLIGSASSSRAVILWSDLGRTVVHETGPGSDILGGAIKRDDTSSDTLYFKFHVAPLSDVTTEEYFAGLELYVGDTERVGVGNAPKAWAYSAFFNPTDSGASTVVPSEVDLRSAEPEPAQSGGAAVHYEFPRRGTERTIIFKVQYVPGGDDLVTVWLNPDLGPGANEVSQPEALTTRFNVDASFDEIRLRHAGGGAGWVFSDLVVATSFSDFVDTSSAKPGTAKTDAGPGRLPFSFESWQKTPGLPPGPIRALAQTPEGYLWVASDDGLARFDGVRFVPIDISRAAPVVPVRALLAGRGGELWIGTADRGLVRYKDGDSTTFTTKQGLPSDRVTALATDLKGNLWVGTEDGLAQFQNGNFTPSVVEALKGKPIPALFVDSQNELWVGATGVDVGCVRGDQWLPLAEPSQKELLGAPHSLLVDRAGRIWIGAGDDFVLCDDHGQWRRYQIPRHTARPYVTALAEAPDGTVWGGSVSEGLFQFIEGKPAAINASSGLSDILIHCLLVDHEGRLWVGSDSGLNQLWRKAVFVFGPEDGLGYGPVLDLAEVVPDEVWAARGDAGIYRWAGRMFSRLTAAGVPSREPRVTALMVARDGSCWVACAAGLLRFKDPQAVADEGFPSGLSEPGIIALAEDGAGTIWAGTEAGKLYRLAKGEWTEQPNPWKKHAVRTIVPMTDGSIWVGTDGDGAYRIKGTIEAHLGTGSGLLSDSIRAISIGGHGTLWIGTAGGGLGMWRDGRTISFTMREGIPENTVSQIVEDENGRLWLGGDHGIACVDEGDLEKVAAGTMTAVHPQVYGRADGLVSEECTGGGGLKTRSGLLWFSTTSGVVMADPRHQPAGGSPPRIVLEDVLVDGLPAPRQKSSAGNSRNDSAAPENLRIPPGKHRLEIQYTGLNSDAPEQIHFRYRLDPLDGDWVDAGVRRTAFYNYVPPGEYRFQVAAADSAGRWNEAGAGLAIVVARYFWQSWWFASFSAIGLMVAVAGTVRRVEIVRHRRRVERLEQERALERERTRIAQDLHDEMGAKLCRISFLSEHTRRDESVPGELQHQIASISDASRDMLHSLDEIVWAVNPQNDTLEQAASYIGQYSQEYFQGTGIECDLEMPPQIPSYPLSSHARHHLFLAVREALTNTLKHSQATKSKVWMKCNGAEFEVIASDNGRGFDSSPAAGNGISSGNGLRNMRERMVAIGGSCHAESNPGGGTTVRFVVPLDRLKPER